MKSLTLALIALCLTMSVSSASALMDWLDWFVGKPAQIFIDKFGPPDEVEQAGLIKKYAWRQNTRFLQRSVGMGGSSTVFSAETAWRIGECVLRLDVDQGNIIIDVDYEGARRACISYVRYADTYRDARAKARAKAAAGTP